MVGVLKTMSQVRHPHMTRKNMPWFFPVLVSILFMFLTGCGGGDDAGGVDSPPVIRTAKLTIGVKRKDNTFASNLGTFQLQVTLPAGFVLSTDSNGYPSSTASLVTGLNVLGVNYTEQTLTMGLHMSNPELTFSTGNLVSFTRTMATNERLPSVGDFTPILQEVTEGSGDTLLDQTANYEHTLTIEEI